MALRPWRRTCTSKRALSAGSRCTSTRSSWANQNALCSTPVRPRGRTKHHALVASFGRQPMCSAAYPERVPLKGVRNLVEWKSVM
eukprot:357821-Chlamydomonas_euryale.AAC.1